MDEEQQKRREIFVENLAASLIEKWPQALTGDEALGFVSGLVELAFPPPLVMVEAESLPLDGMPKEPPLTVFPDLVPSSVRSVDLGSEAAPAAADAEPEVEAAPARRRRQSWDRDQDEKMMRLRRDGLPWEDVAAQLGRDVPSCATRASVLKRAGRWTLDVSGVVLGAHQSQASSLGDVT